MRRGADRRWPRRWRCGRGQHSPNGAAFRHYQRKQYVILLPQTARQLLQTPQPPLVRHSQRQSRLHRIQQLEIQCRAQSLWPRLHERAQLAPAPLNLCRKRLHTRLTPRLPLYPGRPLQSHPWRWRISPPLRALYQLNRRTSGSCCFQPNAQDFDSYRTAACQ